MRPKGAVAGHGADRRRLGQRTASAASRSAGAVRMSTMAVNIEEFLRLQIVRPCPWLRRVHCRRSGTFQLRPDDPAAVPTMARLRHPRRGMRAPNRLLWTWPCCRPKTVYVADSIHGLFGEAAPQRWMGCGCPHRAVLVDGTLALGAPLAALPQGGSDPSIPNAASAWSSPRQPFAQVRVAI